MHPLVVLGVPVGPNGCTVCWYCTSDGTCQARTYLEAIPGKFKAQIAARVRQLAITGQIRGRIGHRLDPPFSDIWELTPDGHRFFVFQERRTFYITNGAKKEPGKRKQRRDYERATQLRKDFYSRRSN